jgi:hypothetical protein
MREAHRLTISGFVRTRGRPSSLLLENALGYMQQSEVEALFQTPGVNTFLIRLVNEHGLVMRLLEVERKADTVVIASEKHMQAIKPYSLVTLVGDTHPMSKNEVSSQCSSENESEQSRYGKRYIHPGPSHITPAAHCPASPDTQSQEDRRRGVGNELMLIDETGNGRSFITQMGDQARNGCNHGSQSTRVQVQTGGRPPATRV